MFFGLLSAVFMAGCSSQPRVPDQNALELKALLDEVSTYYAEEGASRCLSPSMYEHVEIIDERRLLFRGRGKRAWLNDLRSSCKGLQRNDTLVFDLRGSQACALDTVSGVDKIWFWTRSGPTCSLGEFKPLAPAQVAAVDKLLSNK